MKELTRLYRKISIVLFFILALFLKILSMLGEKERIGYLKSFYLNADKTLEINSIEIEDINKYKIEDNSLENYILTNKSINKYSYSSKLEFYSKIFRSSALYEVYIDTNKVLGDNHFIKEINMESQGKPRINLVSSKIIDFEKIDNISYSLSIKKSSSYIMFYITLFIAIIIYLLILYFR
ncbi:hypothetical protein [uncultured Brachyspira sp.]|uniref:hypothetical protein n=1 Tax=uncultured Brachyspira sp. TaxID=221953 RepID=UPI0025D795FF|nr:hypothetical protein [uncultured Brachyspira sp.]